MSAAPYIVTVMFHDLRRGRGMPCCGRDTPFDTEADAKSYARWAFRQDGVYVALIWKTLHQGRRPIAKSQSRQITKSMVDRLHKTIETGELRPAPYPDVNGVNLILTRALLQRRAA